MLVRPFMSRITDLHGSRSRTMASMTFVLAGSIGVIGLLDGYGLLAVAVALTGMGSGVSQPLSLVAVADHTPPTRRGFAIGLRLTGNRFAQVASPVLLGLLVEAAGFSITFGVAGALLLATALAILGRAKAFERAERRLAESTPSRLA
jgi:MFS family permease